jgi:hypothetical protein
MNWRNQTLRVEAMLIQAFEAYRAALCREKTAGIPMAAGGRGYVEMRADYLSARAQAEAFQESARLASAYPTWVGINWSKFPEPLPVEVQNVDVGRWGCK